MKWHRTNAYEPLCNLLCKHLTRGTSFNFYQKLKMYGEPQSLPPNVILLWSQRQYHIKEDGTCHFCQCVNSSKQAAPILHMLTNSYSVCVSQPVQQMFLAILALKRLLHLWWWYNWCICILTSKFCYSYI